MNKLTKLILGFAALFVANIATAADYPDPAKMAVPVVDPSELSMDASAFARIDALVEENIKAGNFPGGVVAIGRGNKLAYLHAYGDRQTEPVVEKTTFDTVYDLASLSNPDYSPADSLSTCRACGTTS